MAKTVSTQEAEVLPQVDLSIWVISESLLLNNSSFNMLSVHKNSPLSKRHQILSTREPFSFVLVPTSANLNKLIS